MNSLKFVNSADAFPEELDLFQTPPTNTTCERLQYVNYRPKTQFQEDAPLEFTIPSTGAQYINLKRTFMKMKVQLLKGTGEEVSHENEVAPANLSLHSMFQRVEVYFNQKLVSGGDVLYPYKSYLETTLDYGKEAKHGHLAAAGYYKDNAFSIEKMSADPTKSGSNKGFVTRYSVTTGGKFWQLEGPILSDICQQERYILNQVEITIKLYPQRKEFFLLSEEASVDYKFRIADAYLPVCVVTPSPWVIIGHKEALEKSNAIYPYTRTEMKTISVTRGEYGFQLEDVFQGSVPKELIIAMVTSQAYNGAYNANPFNLRHFNIGSLSVNIDGQSAPTQPLQLDFLGKSYLDGYMSLFRGLDRDSQDSGFDISPQDYANGYCIFAFNLQSGDYLPLMKRSNVRIEARFLSPLVQNINVILMAKFPSILEIDRERNILLQ